MSDVLLSPLTLLVEFLSIVAIWLLYVALVVRAGRPAVARRARSWFLSLIERERAQAAALGWNPRGWLVIRSAGLVAGLWVGLWVGTPLTIAGGLAAGVVGVPYALSSRAARRRMAMDQAVVEMVRTVASLVRSSNQTLDQALTDQGQNPHPILRDVLTPLTDTHRSIRERLIEVDRRARSPIVNRICLDLLIAHSITAEAFLDAADRVLVPQYERDIQIQQRTHAIAAGARQSAFIVVFLMSVMLLFIMGDASLRSAYESVAGQLVLVLVAAMVAGILWLIHALTPKARSLRWNLTTMDDLLEQRYG